jgi:hypothetical protein
MSLSFLFSFSFWLLFFSRLFVSDNQNKKKKTREMGKPISRTSFLPSLPPPAKFLFLVSHRLEVLLLQSGIEFTAS